MCVAKGGEVGKKRAFVKGRNKRSSSFSRRSKVVTIGRTRVIVYLQKVVSTFDRSVIDTRQPNLTRTVLSPFSTVACHPTSRFRGILNL